LKARYLVDKSALARMPLALSQDLAQAIGDLALLKDEELWRAAQNSLSDDARAELESLARRISCKYVKFHAASFVEAQKVAISSSSLVKSR